MSKSRIVTVYSTQGRGESQSITTDAETWGELKSLIEFGTNNVRAVVRENRTTLEANNAMLPSTDCTVFLYPEKVKSGQDRYDNMTLAELRREVKNRPTMKTESSNLSTLRYKLRTYDKRALKNSGSVVAEKKATASPKRRVVIKPKAVDGACHLPSDSVAIGNPVETQNEAIRSVIEDLKRGFNKAFDDTLRGIEDEGVTKTALKNDADKIASEIGFPSRD